MSGDVHDDKDKDDRKGDGDATKRTAAAVLSRPKSKPPKVVVLRAMMKCRI